MLLFGDIKSQKLNISTKNASFLVFDIFISLEGNFFLVEIFRSFYSQTDLFEDIISSRNIEKHFLLYIRS
jgi:hypothetical protein